MGKLLTAVIVICSLLATHFDGVASLNAEVPRWGRQARRPPAGFTSVRGVGAYKFYAYGAPWAAARRTCIDAGAALLVVNSAAEAAALRNLFKANPKVVDALDRSHVWVGAREHGTHGVFLTDNGVDLREVGYLNWARSPQQPNDPGTDDCVSFYASGTMYDDACNIKYPFVCEF